MIVSSSSRGRFSPGRRRAVGTRPPFSLAPDVPGGVFRQASHVRVQLPLALGSDSEPEPDVAVVSGTARDYRNGHPQTALLVVEIADASLAYDREVKGSLYARAGMPEYWLVKLVDSCVEVYRDPVAIPNTRFGWGYRSRTRVGKNEHLSPPAKPSSRIAVADLLP